MTPGFLDAGAPVSIPPPSHSGLPGPGLGSLPGSFWPQILSIALSPARSVLQPTPRPPLVLILRASWPPHLPHAALADIDQPSH